MTWGERHLNTRRALAVALVALVATAATIVAARSIEGSGGSAASAPAAGGAAPAPAASKSARRPDVVMLVLDEFPAGTLLGPDGRIDAVRYPNFARLAASSTWFPNASTVYDSTAKALPAILDARRPRKGIAPVFQDHPQNAFTMFGRMGYRVTAAESASTLCPRSVCRTPSRTGNITSNLNRGRVERFDKWVAKIERSSKPSFYFNHVLLPHVPWQYLPSGKLYRNGPRESIRGLSSPAGFHDPGITRQNLQRHLLQAVFTDRLLGRLLDRLEKTGTYDDALVAVSSDHGIAFDLNVADRRLVTSRNIDEVAPTLFFVKAPGQRAARVNRAYARSIDLVPTIADLLDVRVPWRADGRSAFGPAARARRVVRMYKRPLDGTVSIGARAFERARAAAVRRNNSLFGHGDDQPGLYGLGPHRELLGRATAEMTVRSGGGLSAALTQTSELRSVKLGGPFIPSLVTGYVRGGSRGAKRNVAIAVNGRIAGLGRSFYLKGSRDEGFASMVPESAFREGRNEVEVFAVERSGGALVLRRLGGT